MTEERNDGSIARRRFDIVYIYVLVLASIFPILGFGAYFRNEDGRYLEWMSKGIFKPFDADFIRSVTTFRPVNMIILDALHRLAGNTPIAFQLASSACFLGAILLMYAIGKRLFKSARAAFLAILLYFACFYFVLHFLYTPIQGFQFPLDLLLVMGAMHLMLTVLPRGQFGWRMIAAGALCLLAVFNHPVSAFLIPVLGITLVLTGWRHCAQELRGRKAHLKMLMAIAFFACLWLLIPVLTRQVRMDRQGVLDLVPIIIERYGVYAPIFLRGINRVLLPIPLAYLLARRMLVRLSPGASPATRFWVCALASCAGAILLIALPVKAAFIILNLLVATAAFGGWQSLFVALWFFAGTLPNLTSWVVTGVYMRHATIALSLLAGAGYSASIDDLVATMGEGARRLNASLKLERAGGALTALVVLAVLAAALHVVSVPIVSRQVAQIEYLKNLGNNFRDTVAFLSMTLDRNASVYFYRGQTRAEENDIAYTSRHLERLQPAKWDHYPSYFIISGRGDITVRFTDELPPGASGAVIVATNNWEVRELESTLPLEIVREFRRGRALARIYRLRGE